MKRLILASASPRRKRLLKQIGLDFDVLPSSVPETWEENTSPPEIALRLAREKAEAIAGNLPSGVVIGADTLVVLEGRILGKPQNPDEAFRFLRKLSGRSHDVITAVVLLDAESGRVLADVEVTRVFFREVSDQEIHAYIASGEPMDKAGAYGIQGRGVLFVKRIEGCYTNVVGLPLGKLGEMLTRILHE
jgi:septum formation protein